MNSKAWFYEQRSSPLIDIDPWLSEVELLIDIGRRRQSENPEDHQAYILLGEAYRRLLRRNLQVKIVKDYRSLRSRFERIFRSGAFKAKFAEHHSDFNPQILDFSASLVPKGQRQREARVNEYSEILSNALLGYLMYHNRSMAIHVTSGHPLPRFTIITNVLFDEDEMEH